MRRIVLIVLLLLSLSNADDKACRSLYDDFMSVLEPQMTALCNTAVEGVYTYRFYVRSEDDSVSYTGMDLVFWENGSHLYIDGDENPFPCKYGSIYRNQSPEEIARILFIPRKDCSQEFRKSIGIKEE